MVRGHSIGTRISVLILAVLVGGLTILVTYQAFSERTRILDTFDDGQYNVTRLLASTMAPAVRFGRAAVIDRSYSALVEDKAALLTDLIVFDASGEVLTSYHALMGNTLQAEMFDRPAFLSGGAVPRRMVTPDGGHTLFAVPVVQGDHVIGGVVAAWSRRPIVQEVLGSLAVQTGMAAVATVALISVLLWLLHRMVVRPVRAMTQAMTQLAGGDDDSPLPPVGDSRELSAMGRAVEVFRRTAREKALLHNELARAHDDLRANAERVRAILSTAPFPILVRRRPSGALLFHNDAAARFFDMPRQSGVVERADYFIDEAVREDIWSSLREGTPILGAEAHVRDGTGDAVWVLISTTPMILDDAPAILVTFTDISDRKRFEDALREAKEEAERAAESKASFLATMSHEIRTPLNAIIGLTYLAMRADVSPDLRDYLSKISGSAEVLRSIIDDILDFSKIEAGHLTLEEAPFDLRKVLENVSTVTALQADEKGLEFLYHVGADVPLGLIGDSLRLGQILYNLTSNAVKFTERGTVVVSVRVAGWKDDRVTLAVAVSDTGIGMSDSQQLSVFNPFTQADGSTTRRFGGTGLGLTISRELVSMMGGDLTVRSMPGRGSTFSFSVSLGVGAPVGLPVWSLDEARGLRVLVVDDNAEARRIFTEILEAVGMVVTSVSSGEEALRRLSVARAEDQPVDLMLLDYHMPGLDGLEVVRRIRQDEAWASLPIIVLVGAHGGLDVAERAAALGVCGCLGKPVESATLYDTIAAIVAEGTGSSPLSCTACRREEAPTLPPHLRHGVILLAEDNEINQQVARQILLECGLTVDVAEDGARAVRMVLDAPERYAAVLMDMQMPTMDGLRATAVIRDTLGDRAPPILAMTAHAMAEEQERCQRAGMVEHLTKPFDPSVVIAALERHMKVPPKAAGDESAGDGGDEPADDGVEEGGPVSGVAAALGGLETAAELPTQMISFDLAELRERMAGQDESLLRWLIARFGVRYAARRGEALRLAQDGDLQELVAATHAAKGAAYSLAARDLATAANDVETAVRFERHRTEAAVEAYEAALDRAVSEALSLVGEDFLDDGDEALDPVKLAPLLVDLHGQLGRGSEAAKPVLSALRAHLTGTDHAPTGTAIGDALARQDFAAAADHLGILARSLGLRLVEPNG